MRRETPIETLEEKYRLIYKDIYERKDFRERAREILEFQKDSEFQAYWKAIGKLSISQIGQNNTYADIYVEINERLIKTSLILENPFILQVSKKIRDMATTKLIPEVISGLQMMSFAKDGLEQLAIRK